MGCEPDEWGKKWPEKQREAGERCLTVEKHADGQHYVIRATTVWVPETKKRRKVSEYLGRSDVKRTMLSLQKEGLLERNGNHRNGEWIVKRR